MYPESKIYFQKIYDKIERYLSQYRSEKFFVIQIDTKNLDSAWYDRDEFDTITTKSGDVHDIAPYYNWYGQKTLFVRRGVRPPVSFENFILIYKKPLNESELLALDGKTAHSKMNNKAISDYIKAKSMANRKYDEVIMYITLGASVLSAMGLFGLIEIDISRNIETILEIVRR